MWKTFTVFLLTIIVLCSFSIATQVLRAQTVAQTQAERAQLEAELKQLETEIAQKQKDLDAQKGQSLSLTNEINTLKTQIDKAKLNIKAKNLLISKLSGQIDEKKTVIETLSTKIDNGRSSLAQLLRKTNEIDKSNMIDILLSGKNLSDFYGDLDSFSSIKKSLSNTVNEIKTAKVDTEVQKKDLELKQDQEIDAKAELERARQQVEKNKAEQQYLLEQSKKAEKEQAKVLADKQSKAAQIRARLFNFAGGTAAIQFGDALNFAETASARTGIEPAFVLAILTQESNLGANVGKCYLTDTTTGAGISTTGKIWPNVMKPSRDVQPFLTIVNRLGLDPYKTVVSCPIAGVAGYGGAMGPAQFIASTWMLLDARIQAAVGASPNPWAPGHAIMASAMYLSDLGASGTSYSAQIRAACKYYGTGGSTCSYGRSVMGLKSKIQDDIDYLKQYGVSRR